MAGRTGRPPKPTHLKLIEGNPGKRRLPEKPKAPPARPTRPAWLKGIARQEWDRVVPWLDRVGLLATVDRATLVAYCEAVDVHQRATRQIKAMPAGGLLIEDRNGLLRKNPLLQVQRDSARMIATFSSMFGFSPSDRARAAWTDTGGAELDLDRILER